MHHEAEAEDILKLLCDNMQITSQGDGKASYLLEIRLDDEGMDRFVGWVVRTSDERNIQEVI